MIDDTFEEMQERAEDLQGTLGETSAILAAFDGEIRRVHQTFSASSKSIEKFDNALSKGLSKAIDGVVLDGMKLSDALETVAKSMISTAYKAAVQPVTEQLSGVITRGVGALFGQSAFFADGASFAQGRVMPFASGGVVAGATHFPMRGGLGLMGEAGPEAIMPLARGVDGKLGVRAQDGGSGVSVVMHITTPDARSFERSQSQIAARLGRALSLGQRNR